MSKEIEQAKEDSQWRQEERRRMFADFYEETHRSVCDSVGQMLEDLGRYFTDDAHAMLRAIRSEIWTTATGRYTGLPFDHRRIVDELRGEESVALKKESER